MMTPRLPCPGCRAPIEISSAQWCHCLSKNLSVICASCHSCFCKLSTAARGAEWNVALRAIVESSRPDIVITDALMPKIDGRELCRLIKRVDPSIKVVVMSGLYTKSHYRVEAMHQFQADEYLAKPINFERLRNVLEDLSSAA